MSSETILPRGQYIDLHIHSSSSDGTCSPAELADLAARQGLAAAALTDHDTVRGIPEFLAAAAAHPGLEAIPGVELSTLYGSRELHFVGLFIDPENPELLQFLAEMREARRERNLTISRKLASLGYEIDLDQLGGAENESLGRPHFARYLVEHYQFDSMQQVFDKLLRRGGAAYTPRRLPDPYRAIATIRAAGGLAIWAHPVYRDSKERNWARRMLKKFVPAGLDGLECYYSTFGPEETRTLLALAEQFDVCPSGGSDFHGGNSSDIQLGIGGGGLRVPVALLAAMKERLRQPRPIHPDNDVTIADLA